MTPKFKTGEGFKVGDWVMVLHRITEKDLILRGQVVGVTMGMEVNCAGRLFRVRKIDGCLVYVRPLDGKRIKLREHKPVSPEVRAPSVRPGRTMLAVAALMGGL